jgi:hypothetical protein
MTMQQGTVGEQASRLDGAQGGSAKVSERLASREKYWEEMDDAQKIRALRDALVRLADEHAALIKTCLDLTQHQHASDGEILLRMHKNYNEMSTTYDRVRVLRMPHERR